MLHGMNIHVRLFLLFDITAEIFPQFFFISCYIEQIILNLKSHAEVFAKPSQRQNVLVASLRYQPAYLCTHPQQTGRLLADHLQTSCTG